LSAALGAVVVLVVETYMRSLRWGGGGHSKPINTCVFFL